MRIIVFSDSHYDADALLCVLRLQPDADLYIHLGDGYHDTLALRAEFPEIPLITVRGNCDLTGNIEEEKLLTLDGRRLLLVHGHRYSVKSGLDKLEARALQIGADMVLFGHTHKPYCRQRNSLWFVNPGSVASGNSVRFAIIDLLPGGVVCHATSAKRVRDRF